MIADDLVRQRPAVADAGRAAVADEVEAERLERRHQAGLLEIGGDDLRAGREGRLHPRLAGQAALDRLLGQQAGADHHARVRGVGAAGDRRDDDGAVIDLVGPLAAAPWRRPVARGGRPGRALLQRRLHLGRRDRELRLGLLQRDAILRPARAGEARHDRRRGRRRSTVRVGRLGRLRRCGTGPAPWCTPRPARCRPSGGRSGAGSRASSSSIGKMAIVAPYSGAMLPSVARSATVSDAMPGPKNSTNLPTTPCLRRRSVTVSTRSVAVAPSGSLPFSRTPRTSGISIEIGWPSIAASASMPPTPQPTTPRPLTIVVCESVPTSVSGNACEDAVARLAADDAGEVLDVHLVDDAGLGRDDAEVAEGALAPAQEDVALAVALIFELAVQLEGGRLAEVVDLHRVVDDELDGLQRVDVLRIAAERGDAVAHRREIDDGGHAREVLQQHARRRERDLALGVLRPGSSWRAPRCRPS